MNVKFWAAGAALFLLSGCAAPPPGELRYTNCGFDHHTEAYPLADDARKAFGCKADSEGFLEGAAQADKARN